MIAHNALLIVSQTIHDFDQLGHCRRSIELSMDGVGNGQATGEWLAEHEYKLYLGFFKDDVARKLL